MLTGPLVWRHGGVTAPWKRLCQQISGCKRLLSVNFTAVIQFIYNILGFPLSISEKIAMPCPACQQISHLISNIPLPVTFGLDGPESCGLVCHQARLRLDFKLVFRFIYFYSGAIVNKLIALTFLAMFFRCKRTSA